MASIRLPERVSAAVAALRLAGQRWLAGLPELVSSLEADWAVTCGTALEGRNAAYVAEEVTADGSVQFSRLPCRRASTASLPSSRNCRHSRTQAATPTPG
jgi:hypothetical protein